MWAGGALAPLLNFLKMMKRTRHLVLGLWAMVATPPPRYRTGLDQGGLLGEKWLSLLQIGRGKNSKNSKPRRYKKNKSVVVDCNQPRIDVVLKGIDPEKVTGEDGVSLIQINSAFSGESHSEQMMDGGENL